MIGADVNAGAGRGVFSERWKMPKRAVLLVSFLSALLFFGQAAPPGGGQALAPGAKAAELVSFLRDDSFRAAAQLAGHLLAIPAGSLCARVARQRAPSGHRQPAGHRCD